MIIFSNWLVFDLDEYQQENNLYKTAKYLLNQLKQIEFNELEKIQTEIDLLLAKELIEKK